MTPAIGKLWRGALAGLALLLLLQAQAEDPLRDANYVAFIDDTGRSSILLFSAESERIYHDSQAAADPDIEEKMALELTVSAIPRERVRGLTLLAGMTTRAALDAGLVLLNDPEPRVRDEARNLVALHSLTDESQRAEIETPTDE